ncbi:hypothetical protein OIU78_012035 [Salix suchowensis]|nr:hypothetical protein OIU78_012035 [Salix suchowensis]
MADQCMQGWILATLSVLFATCCLLIKKKERGTKKDLLESRSKSVNCTAATNEECRSGNFSDADVIIVGAGVAGAALAHTLGKMATGNILQSLKKSCHAVIEIEDGRRVRVIERDLTEPDRIVGELLQPGGYLNLIELGLEDCVEKIDAQKVFGYALFKDGKHTRLSYPLEKFHSDVAGRSFHNGRFIQRMREKAVSLPNVQLEQGTVTSLLEEKGTVRGVQYKTKDGQELTAFAPLTIVCDGCFSNLRRSLCNPKGDPSPILMYPISSTEIRCLVDVPGQKVPSISNGEMAKYLKTVVAPQIPPEVRDAFLAAVDEGNIRTMPNRSMPADPYPTPWPLCDLNDAPTLCRYLESFYTLRKPVASTINTLAGALYKVFCASPDQARKEMRQACFDYLSLGGVFSEGPVSLLSGLNPRPLSLVAHFFAVAVYGVGRLLLPFPSPKRIWIGARLISGASGIIFPIMRSEGIRQMFFPATVPAYYRAPPVKRD